MKTVRKLLIALLVLIYTVSTSGNVLAEWEPISVDSLDVTHEKSINVSLNNEIDVNALSEWDMKLLHDIVVLDSSLDSADSRKALINLDQDLSSDSVYNLITIEGTDGSMDFETWANLEWEEIYNESGEWIESIFIIDSKNLEVTYFEPITETEVNLKLFRDASIKNLESDTNTEIRVETMEVLKASSNYIFMLISAKNIDNSDATIENGIYNFETPAFLDDAPLAEEDLNLNAATEEWTEPVTTEEVVNEEIIEIPAEEVVVVEEEIVQEEAVEADATVIEENVTKAGNVITEESNIEEVAAGATAVPETGTASTLMIFLTMLLAFWVHMKRRK